MDKRSDDQAQMADDRLSGIKADFANLSPSLRKCLALRASLRSIPIITHEKGNGFPMAFLAAARAAHVVAASSLNDRGSLENERLGSECYIETLPGLRIGAISQAFLHLLEAYKYTEDVPHFLEGIRMAAMGAGVSFTELHKKSAQDFLYDSIFTDLELAASGTDVVEFQDAALWHHEMLHSDTISALATLNGIFAEDEHRTWAYFSEWYQGLLDGRPLNLELQRRVALIEGEVWKAGPEAVAAEIEKIHAKLNLEQRIEELEADLHRVVLNRHGIGGNMPPDPLDDVVIARKLVIILAPLRDLKLEINKDQPNPTKIQKVIEALIAALKKGLAWCLKKSDLVVDTAIKWAIPAGGTGYLALNPEKLEAVIEAAKKLLSIQ